MWAFFMDPVVRTLVLQWEERARGLLGQFRASAGRHAGDPSFTELITCLRENSDEFRSWWDSYDVAEFELVEHRLDHPVAGLLTLELAQLTMADQPGVRIVLQTPRRRPYERLARPTRWGDSLRDAGGLTDGTGPSDQAASSRFPSSAGLDTVRHGWACCSSSPSP